jgi:hypothetical protein
MSLIYSKADNVENLDMIGNKGEQIEVVELPSYYECTGLQIVTRDF